MSEPRKQSVPPGPTGASRRPADGRSGRMVVASMVMLGVIAGLVAVSYWTGVVGRTWDESGQPREDEARAREMEQADDRLTAMQELFQSMVSEEGPRADMADVLAAAERFVRDYPGHVNGHVHLALVLADLGRVEDAYDHFATAVSLNQRDAQLETPALAHVQRLMGAISAQRQQFDRAAEHFHQAIQLEPENLGHRMHLAKAHLDQNDFESVRRVALEALRLDDMAHEAHALLRDAYARQNKIVPALTQARKALELAPVGEPAARVAYAVRLASLLARDNRAEEGLIELDRLPRSLQQQPDVVREKVKLWSMQGRFDRAAMVFEEQLEVDPLNPDYLAGAATYRLRTEQLELAREHLRTLRQVRPNDDRLADLETAAGVSGS